MKNDGFNTPNIWAITPKNEGCGFPWFLINSHAFGQIHLWQAAARGNLRSGRDFFEWGIARRTEMGSLTGVNGSKISHTSVVNK